MWKPEILNKFLNAKEPGFLNNLLYEIMKSRLYKGELMYT